MPIFSGLPGILLVIFVTLKLCGVIAWSWLWVLSPLWITFLVGAGLILGFGILADSLRCGWR